MIFSLSGFDDATFKSRVALTSLPSETRQRFRRLKIFANKTVYSIVIVFGCDLEKKSYA